MDATIRLRVWEIVPVLLVEVILHDLGRFEHGGTRSWFATNEL